MFTLTNVFSKSHEANLHDMYAFHAQADTKQEFSSSSSGIDEHFSATPLAPTHAQLSSDVSTALGACLIRSELEFNTASLAEMQQQFGVRKAPKQPLSLVITTVDVNGVRRVYTVSIMFRTGKNKAQSCRVPCVILHPRHGAFSVHNNRIVPLQNATARLVEARSTVVSRTMKQKEAKRRYVEEHQIRLDECIILHRCTPSWMKLDGGSYLELKASGVYTMLSPLQFSSVAVCAYHCTRNMQASFTSTCHLASRPYTVALLEPRAADDSAPPAAGQRSSPQKSLPPSTPMSPMHEQPPLSPRQLYQPHPQLPLQTISTLGLYDNDNDNDNDNDLTLFSSWRLDMDQWFTH